MAAPRGCRKPLEKRARPFPSPVGLPGAAAAGRGVPMAARGRFPAASEGPWAGAADEAVEEANPFSFKEFVRSQSQREAGVDSSKANPEEFSSVMLGDDSLYPKSLGLSLECQESFFSDPTATSSLLEDEEDGWSGTYQPSAVEEAHLARVPSSNFDSFYCDSSDLLTPSPWQLRESDCYQHDPLGKGDQSLSLDEETVEDGFYQPLQPSCEELKQDNSKLKNKISCLQTVCEAQANRVKELERKLEDHKLKEAKEAQDLEAMVQQVEENLQLMTKRAVKAENSVIKLKQENAQLQAQMKNCQLENEALKSSHSANLAVMKKNVDIALQNLLAIITKSHSSINRMHIPNPAAKGKILQELQHSPAVRMSGWAQWQSLCLACRRPPGSIPGISIWEGSGSCCLGRKDCNS